MHFARSKKVERPRLWSAGVRLVNSVEIGSAQPLNFFLPLFSSSFTFSLRSLFGGGSGGSSDCRVGSSCFSGSCAGGLFSSSPIFGFYFMIWIFTGCSAFKDHAKK